MTMIILLTLFQYGSMFRYTAFNSKKISFEQQYKYWVQQVDQVQDQKGFICQEGVKYFGNIDPTYAIIRRFQVPSHSTLQIKFDLYTFKFSQDQQVEVFINNVKILNKLTLEGSKHVQCEKNTWYVNSVEFNIQNYQESFYLIIQVTYDEKNFKDKLWGIGNFELQTNYCEKLFCDTETLWFYQYRKYFFNNFFNFSGLDRNSRLTFKLNPHTQVRIQFILYVKTITYDYQLRLIQLENNNVQKVLWNQLISNQDWNNIEYLFYHCDVPAVAQGSDLILVFQMDEGSQIGIRDIIIYSDRCPDNCSQCKIHYCQDCKPGYSNTKSDNVCKPDYRNDFDKVIVQIEKSYLNKIRLKDPQQQIEEWKIIDGKQSTSLFLNEFLILGGENYFNRQSKIHKKLNFQQDIYYYIRLQAQICLKTIEKKFPIIKVNQYNNQFKYLNDPKDDNSEYYEFETKDIFQAQDGATYLIKEIERNLFPIKGQTVMGIELYLQYGQTSNAFSKDYWGIRNINIEGILHEKLNQCALLFTQINYQGESYSICDKVENFEQKAIPSSIRSLKIPQGGKITLYSKSEYKGKYLVFLKDTPVLDQEMYLENHNQDVKASE